MGKRQKLARRAAATAGRQATSSTSASTEGRPVRKSAPSKGAGNSRWDALTQLESAERDYRQAGQVRDRLVATARGRGASWVDVGQAVGVSRQAARQRWGSTSSTTGERRSP